MSRVNRIAWKMTVKMAMVVVVVVYYTMHVVKLDAAHCYRQSSVVDLS